jgi:hypothetical protein
MPEPDLDPRDTIDREAEQELFAGLVSFKTPARMLVISDTVDRGKSTLLRRLEYNCKWVINPPVSACLVDLSQLKDPSPFGFIEEVVKGLNIEQRFSKFSGLNKARKEGDYKPFEDGGGTARGETIAGKLSGGTAIGQQVNIDSLHGNVTITRELTDGQEYYARQKCIEGFFEDLRGVCATQPLTILLDAWESCNYDLRRWITGTLMRQHCFNPDKNLRPDKLIVVLAGDSYDKVKIRYGIRDDEFANMFTSEQELAASVQSIKSLGDWTIKHLRAFLEQNGYINVPDDGVILCQKRLKEGTTLRRILEGIKAFYS